VTVRPCWFGRKRAYMDVYGPHNTAKELRTFLKRLPGSEATASSA
jgi:hypothetical protein